LALDPSLDAAESGDLTRYVILQLPVPLPFVDVEASGESTGPLSRWRALSALSEIIGGLTEVQLPGFEGFDVVSVEQLERASAWERPAITEKSRSAEYRYDSK
jgi:hypothetical protein